MAMMLMMRAVRGILRSRRLRRLGCRLAGALCAIILLLIIHLYERGSLPVYDIEYQIPASDLRVSGEENIPRVIHQIWLGGGRPPCQWMGYWAHDYIEANPGWTYRLWTEGDILAMGLKNLEEYELETRLANKADIARFEILYRHGGVYIDSDSVWVNRKSLDPLLEQAKPTGLFVGRQERPYTARVPGEPFPLYAVGVIGAVPRHPALAHVVANLHKNYRSLRFKQRVKPWKATGPDFFTAALDGVPVTVFPQSAFFPGGWWHNSVFDSFEEHAKQYPDSYMLQLGLSTQPDAQRQAEKGISEHHPRIDTCLKHFGIPPDQWYGAVKQSSAAASDGVLTRLLSLLRRRS